MSPEPKNVPEAIARESRISLSGCLVDGNAEQRTRERRVRRRALALSIVLQGAALTALVLIPLFGKTEHIALGKSCVPIPPYGHPANHARGTQKPAPSPPTKAGNRYNIFPAPTDRPEPPRTGEEGPIGPPVIGSSGEQQNDGQVCNWCVTGDKNSGPRPPQPEIEPSQKPAVMHVTHLDPGMLIHRVEPIYPFLPKQMHREGRVELRALIATDGSIQSLQVVGGDPLFYQSALEAVRQWHYRATFLNGKAVEIDTAITVIYTIGH
jgi:TonB family protein